MNNQQEDYAWAASLLRTHGDAIVAAREGLAWSQEKLAAEAGVEQSFITRAENEQGKRGKEGLIRVADALGVDLPVIANVGYSPASNNQMITAAYNELLAFAWSLVESDDDDTQQTKYFGRPIERLKAEIKNASEQQLQLFKSIDQNQKELALQRFIENGWDSLFLSSSRSLETVASKFLSYELLEDYKCKILGLLGTSLEYCDFASTKVDEDNIPIEVAIHYKFIHLNETARETWRSTLHTRLDYLVSIDPRESKNIDEFGDAIVSFDLALSPKFKSLGHQLDALTRDVVDILHLVYFDFADPENDVNPHAYQQMCNLLVVTRIDEFNICSQLLDSETSFGASNFTTWIKDRRKSIHLMTNAIRLGRLDTIASVVGIVDLLKNLSHLPGLSLGPSEYLQSTNGELDYSDPGVRLYLQHHWNWFCVSSSKPFIDFSHRLFAYYVDVARGEPRRW